MKKLELIQASRAIVPLLVIVFHTSLLMNSYFDYNFLGVAELPRSGGVDYFFVLTGFMIFYIYYKKIEVKRQFIGFLKSRFLRIYPLYWVVTLTIIPVYYLVPTFGNGYEAEINVIAKSLFLLPQETLPVVVAAWSLCYTVAYYLIFSLFFLMRRRIAVSIIGSWAGVILLHAAIGLTNNFYFDFFLNGLFLNFIFGSLCAFIIVNYNVKSSWLLITIGILGFPAAWLNDLFGVVSFPAVVVYGFSSIILILGISSFEKTREVQIPSWMTSLGHASYSTYLTHYMALSLYTKIIQQFGIFDILGGFVCGLVAVLLAVLTGCATYSFLEKPLYNWLKGREKGDRLMKLYHALSFHWHKFFRHIHRQNGKWQNNAFERHHQAMKYHEERM